MGQAVSGQIRILADSKSQRPGGRTWKCVLWKDSCTTRDGGYSLKVNCDKLKRYTVNSKANTRM